LRWRQEDQEFEANWAWWLMPVILATWEAEIRGIEVPGLSGQIVGETPSQITRSEWTRGMAQLVECLLSKCENLNSDPSPTKRKKSLRPAWNM
jgi:hypothetical protein